jgi:hypothetical protein
MLTHGEHMRSIRMAPIRSRIIRAAYFYGIARNETFSITSAPQLRLIYTARGLLMAVAGEGSQSPTQLEDGEAALAVPRP